MEGIGVCFNPYSKRFKSEIKHCFTLIHRMGGSVIKDVKSTRLTHLVTDVCRGDKYRYASTFGIPVMSISWVKDAWQNHQNDVNFKATETDFVEKHKVKPFHGAHVHFLGFDKSEVDLMISELVRNGGKFCVEPSAADDSCTHVVVDDSKVQTLPSHIESLRKDIPIVKVEWFWASIQMDASAEEKLHLFSTESSLYLSPGGFDRSGNCLLSPGTPGSTSRRRKRRKEALSQLAANDYNPLHQSKTRRSSVSELAMLSMSGSFLDTPDQTPIAGATR